MHGYNDEDNCCVCMVTQHFHTVDSYIYATNNKKMNGLLRFHDNDYSYAPDCCN